MRRSYRSFFLLTVFVLLFGVSGLAAALLDDGRIAVVVETGVDANGVKHYRVATDADVAAKNLYAWASKDPAVARAAECFKQAQQLQLDALGAGLSAEDRALLASGPDRVYIEVKNGTGCAVCDWKARYVVDNAAGQQDAVYGPRIVVQTGDPVFAGGNASLRSQTLVHEIGHGVMTMAYTPDQLPTTPWLKLDHAGIMVTDGKLALIEGWAEFFGAYFTGRLTIAEDPANCIPDNAYANDADGNPKSAAELYKTEGWAATVLYHMATDKRITGFEDKVLQVQLETRPQTFEALMNEYQKMYPGDRAVVREIVCVDSFRQIYPEAAPAQSQPTLISNLPTSNPPSNLNPLSLGPALTSSGGGDTPLLPILSAGLGGVLGLAAIGGPLGLILGGVVGALVGSFLSANMSSLASAPLASVLAPAAPSVQAPELQTTPSAPSWQDGEAPADADLATLRQGFHKSMHAYLESLGNPDPLAQGEAREAYIRAREAYMRAKRAGGRE